MCASSQSRMRGRRPPRLMCLWSQMQCPAVNLMIPPSGTTSGRWEPKHLWAILFGGERRGVCDTYRGGPALIRAGPTLFPSSRGGSRLILSLPCPTAYPLHKEVVLFVQCQACVRKFICISRCAQRAPPPAPSGSDVHRGPPADLGNKVFPKSKYLTWCSFQVAPKKEVCHE